MTVPRGRNRGKAPALLLTGLLVTAVASLAYLVHPASLATTNNRTTDFVLAFAPARPASASVVIVDIDEKSLARFGQWPWPRYRLARLLQTINESGAASIGLDLILAEPDRTSLHNQQTGSGVWPRYPAQPPGGGIDPQDHDHYLAETLAKGPFVLGYEFLFQGGAPATDHGRLHPASIVLVNKSASAKDTPRFFSAQGVVGNPPLLSGAVRYSGFLNATPDGDGILRRVPMLIRYEDGLYPSLALAVLMQYGKNSQIEILQGKIGRLDLLVGGRSLPVDTQGNLIVQFSRRADATPRLSAGDILAGKIPPDRLKGKCVLVGSSAAGLAPSYQTPARALLTHADVHAQVLDNLLAGRPVVRTRSFLLWEVLAGLLVATGAGLAVARLGILPSAGVCLSLLAGSWMCVVLILRARGLLFSPLLPTVLVPLNYAVLTILKTRKIQIVAREAADSTLVLLKSSEKNLDSIIKAIPDIIFRLDPAGRITFISPAIAKYHCSSDALLGQPIFQLVAPQDLAKARNRLNEKRTGERATHGLELRLLLPQPGEGQSAAPGYFSVSVEGIYQGERPCPDQFIGTQGIIRDITNQKKLEETLLQSQKMEAIGRLASGVAHDLNNILVGLVAYPDLLLLELPPDSPLREKITLIQRSGQKAAAIVQDLLTLGRRGVIVSEVTDLNAVIEEYLTSLEFEAAWKHHPTTALESDLAPDLLMIKGSKVHLGKVVMNLLSNAAEAMPAGGTIRISTCNRYLESPLRHYEEIPPGEYVCLSVADEGVGISEADLPRIFEPFFSMKSMQRSGSGLGMTVVWTTVKDHGGFVDLQSKEGEGTRIEIFLPATREQEDQSSQRMLLENYLGTERVLVVDDVPEQLQIAANMLGKLGYEVATVASGEAAVAYLGVHDADLVVLDMVMPGGMDGLETYRKILETRPGQRAIITSGYSGSERVCALQALGAGAYVQKPYTLGKIGIAVRRELDRQKPMRNGNGSKDG
jgi:two-component system, cell cycle sensor histidine kinase and response regulator CckA